jgi:kumamolisin
LIELGGGYRPADLTTYFTGLGVKSPTVKAVSVDHGKNAPTGSADGPDGEVMLDVEVVGAIAPQAHIAVYFAPNTDAGFLDAITTAIHDTKNKPSVISISWGGPESSWTSQAMTAMSSAFQAAATQWASRFAWRREMAARAMASRAEITWIFRPRAHLHWPAAAPASPLQGSSITQEVVWNEGANNGATGGGISTEFRAATWQANLKASRPRARQCTQHARRARRRGQCRSRKRLRCAHRWYRIR